MASEHVANFVSTILSRALTLVAYAAVVRYFLNVGSASDFATISLLLLVFSYVQLLDLGIGYAVTQRFGRAMTVGASDAGSILSTALPMYFVCATAASAVLWVAAGPICVLLFRADVHADALRTLALGIWPLFLSAFAAAILQALNRLVWVNVSRTLIEIFKAVAFLRAATDDSAIETAVAITVVGAFVRVVLDMLIVRRVLPVSISWRPRLSRTDILQNFSMAWPMVVALVLGIVNTLLDRVYVSRVLGSEELAHYTVAYDVNSKAFFLVGAVATVLYTPILRRSVLARSQRPFLLVSYLSVALLTVAYFVPLAVFAEPILAWWINADAATNAGGVTRIAAAMGVAYLTMSVVFNVLQASGRAIALMNGTIIASSSLAGGLAMMPVAWGAEGVMGVVTLSFLAQFVYYLVVILKGR